MTLFMGVYKENRTRVFEIYGIKPTDRRFNCHHIQLKSEGGSDAKSNLCPLPIEDHKRLHQRIQELEEGIRYEKFRKNTPTKRKPKRRKKKRR